LIRCVAMRGVGARNWRSPAVPALAAGSMGLRSGRARSSGSLTRSAEEGIGSAAVERGAHPIPEIAPVLASRAILTDRETRVPCGPVS